MKTLSQKLPALIVITVGLLALFASSAICAIGGETAQQFAPIPQATAQIALDRREQEAQVTATYIEVLSSETVSDTQNTHALNRETARQDAQRNNDVQSALSSAKILGIWLTVGTLGCMACGAGAWLGGRGVAAGARHVASARIPPSRRLPDGLNVMRLPSGEIRAIETRAGGAQWAVEDDRPGDTIAASDIRAFQFGVIKALVGAVTEQKRLN